MERLDALRKANPQMPIYCVCEDEFKKYGRLVDIDPKEMIDRVKETTEIPAEGSNYVPALESIDTMPLADEYRQTLCGQLDEQWGLCWGHNNFMNALEWHTCNEFNVGVTDLVLLLAKRGDIDPDGRLDANKVKAFYLPEGKMIEVYSDTLHFCPCEVDKNGFSAVVGLQRGTNTEIDPAMKKDALVTARNKWLMGWEGNERMKAFGIFCGIYGENWEIKTI